MVSPARRTRQTWELVGRDLPGIEAETVPVIYEASPGRILDAVRSAPHTAATLLMICHDPGFQDLGLLLVGDGSPTLRASLRDKLPTAGLAVVDFAAEDWGGVGRAGGRLDRFVTPRGLADSASRWAVMREGRRPADRFAKCNTGISTRSNNAIIKTDCQF